MIAAGLIKPLNFEDKQDKIKQTGQTTLKPEVDTLISIARDFRTLISDLLEVSRIEQGRLKTEYSDINIADVINKVIETMKPLADQKGLELVFSPIKMPQIKSDPNRVRQVLTNLLSNSIKYTLKGEVDISVTEKAKFIEVTVKDTGIGIPASELQNLFSKFHRVKDKQTAEVTGTGLGLWITKEIVETLGGMYVLEFHQPCQF